MLVQRVISPVSSRESWTVLGDDDAPVEPIERYLAYLTDIERSPNTVKAYAHDLKDWFVFLADRGLDWRRVRLDDVGEFVAWLRLPLPARDRRVAVLPSVEHQCARVDGQPEVVGAGYVLYARGPRRGRCRRAAGELAARRFARWVEAVPAPHQQEPTTAASGDRVEGAEEAARVLTAAEVQTILDGCGRLRDRLLFALLYDTGMRIGEALGLRHNDIAAAEQEVTVRRRDNDNGARAKSRHHARSRSAPS